MKDELFFNEDDKMIINMKMPDMDVMPLDLFMLQVGRPELMSDRAKQYFIRHGANKDKLYQQNTI